LELVAAVPENREEIVKIAAVFIAALVGAIIYRSKGKGGIGRRDHRGDIQLVRQLKKEGSVGDRNHGAFLGFFALLAILRIIHFGTITIASNSLHYYNWLFGPRDISINTIESLEIGGIWLIHLKVTHLRNGGSSINKRIMLGTLNAAQLISLIKRLKQANQAIALGPRLQKSISCHQDKFRRVRDRPSYHVGSCL
jgi:hypothetical protein